MNTLRQTLLMIAIPLFLPACDGAPAASDDAGPCELGTLGCACAQGDVCATTEDGEMLLCQEGNCIAPRCLPGSATCVCRGGTECDGDDLECRDGICRGTGCAAGEMGCECLAGTCGADLYCDRSLGGGTCVDGTGYPGGACPDMGLCRDQSRCDQDLDICVPCSRGSQGCVPTEDGRCNDGLLLTAGRCLPPEPGAPADPQCYTPCRGDLIGDDGSVRRCGADGLIEGCVGELVCTNGSCVPVGEAPPSCTTDTDCPGSQRCLAGACYYDCEADADCGTGRICYAHACRVPCAWPTTPDTACPEGLRCDSPSGIGGVCLPMTPIDPDAERHTEIEASFTLDHDTLVLGSGDGSFRVAHDGAGRETFTIERVSHRAYDRDGNLVDEADASAGDAPLDWVELRYGDAHALAGDLEVTVEPGCDTDSCPPITIHGAAPADDAWARWEGTLRIRHAELGDRYVSLAWTRGLDGRWSGTMYYFANFDERGVAEWAAGDRAGAGAVQNALIQRWAAFRSGRMMGGFHEMQAVFTATSSGSWSWPSTISACLTAHPDGRAACYLFDGDASGIRTYVTNSSVAAVPTGVSELPFAMNIRAEGGRLTMSGRIESALALHYPGEPRIDLTFASDPGSCAAGFGADCVAMVASMASETAVGGRYLPADGDCAPGYATQAFPWLVAGFRAGAVSDFTTGGASRTECRDSAVPFAGLPEVDASLAGANPVPDGRPRCRTLSALDGALVGGDTLAVIFEERFHSCVDPYDSQAFSAYGYMLLTRQPTALEGDDFRATASVVPSSEPPAALGVACDPQLVRDVLDDFDAVLDGSDETREVAIQLAETLRTGRAPGTAGAVDPSTVHYYCEATGLIDGGPADDGGVGASSVACPLGSNVSYFTFTDGTSPTAAEIAGLSCQGGYDESAGTRASCGTVVESWAAGGRIAQDLVWTCADGATYCSDDRLDLRDGKAAFFRPGPALFLPMGSAVEDAFRYKLRFQSPEGRTLGFAPVVCDETSDLTPYCYDPVAIEELRARVDCLAAIYVAYPQSSAAGAPVDSRLTALRRLLSASFSAAETSSASSGTPLVTDGFERLYAELLIMLGDDAMTNALRSRFDEAASHGASFEGSRFEPDGIDLSGTAGYEMRSLYQAAQYYQLALDRLYDLMPVLQHALESDAGVDPDDVVTPGTVTYYLERVIRGAAQKARAWGEIARRYHDLHRADLARSVLERAYAGSYLESVVIGRLMQSIAREVGASHTAELELALEDAMRSYGVALTEMQEVHQTLTDEVTYFGFPADYVPFPVLATNDVLASNSFEDVLRTTQEFVADARANEEVAIVSSRAFDTDAESFQAELVRLARSYEERLGPICGYFTGTDGRTYPAITQYAERDPRAGLLGDPCGRMENGQLHDQVIQLQQLAAQRQLLTTRFANLQAQIHDEAERVDLQCGLVHALADFEYRQGERTLTMEDSIRAMSLVMSTLDRTLSNANAVFGLLAGGPSGSAYAGAYAGLAAPTQAAILALSVATDVTEHEIAQTDLETARWRTERQCDQLSIDSEMVMRSKIRELAELKLQAQQLALDVALAEADLHGLALQARRIQQELAEAEQLSIRVETARNDPNVRLYRNDAILNAEHSFTLAMQHVYRATRVFEYYSSESYPDRERLFQIRMISHGEDNIDRYLADLRNAYLLFEEEAHAPANRVERLSLMDDILEIPLLTAEGRPLSQSEREALLHERLTDPAFLDSRGHLVIPFQTQPEQLSPCTRNHKINFIEVAIQGSGLGDDQANVNVWQVGTGTIQSLGGGTQYYRLPPALSVVQAYFGRNNTVFDPIVYRRYELRERPYLDTEWRIEIDQRDDIDNQDIDLNQITDVYLYLYYTDFTDPGACGD